MCQCTGYDCTVGRLAPGKSVANFMDLFFIELSSSGKYRKEYKLARVGSPVYQHHLGTGNTSLRAFKLRFRIRRLPRVCLLT